MTQLKYPSPAHLMIIRVGPGLAHEQPLESTVQQHPHLLLANPFIFGLISKDVKNDWLSLYVCCIYICNSLSESPVFLLFFHSHS